MFRHPPSPCSHQPSFIAEFINFPFENKMNEEERKGIKEDVVMAVWVPPQAAQVALWIKNLPANTGHPGDPSLIPGSGRSPGGGNGNPLQYPCLENPVDRGAWWAAIHGVAKSQDMTEWLSTQHTSSGSGSWLGPRGTGTLGVGHGGRMWGLQCSSPGLRSTWGHKDTPGDLLWCDGVGAPVGPWGQWAEGWSGRSSWRKHHLNPQESFLPQSTLPGFSAFTRCLPLHRVVVGR